MGLLNYGKDVPREPCTPKRRVRQILVCGEEPGVGIAGREMAWLDGNRLMTRRFHFWELGIGCAKGCGQCPAQPKTAKALGCMGKQGAQAMRSPAVLGAYRGMMPEITRHPACADFKAPFGFWGLGVPLPRGAAWSFWELE